jgi:hypothetical protein
VDVSDAPCRSPASRENPIKFHPLACALPTALLVGIVVGIAAAAEQIPSNEPCVKGPVSEIPETIRKKQDGESGITWYSDPSSPENVNTDAFYLYAGKRGCEVWLRLRIQLVSEKPLNVARLQVKADDKTFELSDPRFKRDSDGKLNWQWLDEKVTTDHLVMLFTITAAKIATLRIFGASQSEDFTIPEAEKDALKTVLSVYTALGGKL